MVVSAGNFSRPRPSRCTCNLHPLDASRPIFAEALQAAGKIRPVLVYLVKISGCWLVVVVVCKRGCPVAFPEIRMPAGRNTALLSCRYTSAAQWRSPALFLRRVLAVCVRFVRCFKEIHFCIIGCSENVFLLPECTMPAPFTSSFPQSSTGIFFSVDQTHGFQDKGGIQHRAGLSKFLIPSSHTDPPSFSPLDPPLSPACSFCGR